jgi:hypothetical protein
MRKMDRRTLSQHIQSLEEHLLRSDVRKSEEEIHQLISEDYKEFGQSGRIFNKQDIITGLLNETPTQLDLSNFNFKLLSPDIALATYVVFNHSRQRRSLRSSIWMRKGEAWKMVFHQGTPTDEDLAKLFPSQ